mgnify:CR=1 FL=1
MLIYEAERSDRRGYLYCQRDHNFSFPAHLHHSYEFLTVQAGTLTCTLETDTFEIHPGEALLVLPDQIHSYHTNGASQSVLWIFSDDWVPEFSAQLGQRAFADPVFRIEAAPLMELLWQGNNRCKKHCGAVHDLRCCAGAVPPAPAPPSRTRTPPVGPHHQLCAAELYRQPDAGADGA